MPTTTDIANTVMAIVAREAKGCPVQCGSDLRDDLGLDSLGRVPLTIGIENAFNLDIPDSDASDWSTVGDIIAYVTTATEGRAA